MFLSFRVVCSNSFKFVPLRSMLKQAFVHPKNTLVPLPKVVILTGVSGIGKSKFAAQLAVRLNGEIISADSVNVYKGLNIGSNKESLLKSCMEYGVPLHLVNTISFNETFSMAHYSTLARSLAKDIINRGKVPILVGGTGFYINGFLMGPSQAPKRDAQITESIQNQLKMDNCWEKSLKRLSDIDPEEAAQMPKNNYFRLVRALEINLQSGMPKSSFSMNSPIPYDVRSFCIIAFPRERIYRLIDERCEKMIDSGFFLEVIQLLEAGLPTTTTKNPASLAIGYREAMDFILRENFSVDSFVKFLGEFQAKSRQYARKQLLWFRHQAPVPFYWCDTTTEDIVMAVQRLTLMERHEYEADLKNSKTYDMDPLERKKMKCYIPKCHLFDATTEVGSRNIEHVLEEVKRVRNYKI